MAMMSKTENLTPSSQARLPLLSRLAFDLAFTIAKWQTRSATRRNLRALDQHLLRDIGLAAEDARCESTKRFWQD